jgi:hypothetical protein
LGEYWDASVQSASASRMLLQPLDPFPELSHAQQHLLDGNALLASCRAT